MAQEATTPILAWVAGHFYVIARARRWLDIDGECSWLMARRKCWHWASWRPSTSGSEAGDELIHQNLVQAPSSGRVGPFLQSAQGGGTANFVLYANCCLHGHVAAQCIVVIEVLRAPRQTIDALAHDRLATLCVIKSGLRRWSAMHLPAARIRPSLRCSFHL